MPGGGTARQPLQFGASSMPQLPRPVAIPARSSSQYLLQEGPEPGFQGGARPASNPQVAPQPVTAPIPHVGSRPQASVSNPTALPRAFTQQSQPRTTVLRPISRNVSPALVQQSPEEIIQHGQPLSMTPASVSATAQPRILTAAPNRVHGSSQNPSQSTIVSQAQASQQQQTAGTGTIAGLQQTSSGVRPAISGTIPSSVGDVPHRDRSVDNRVLVNVCDRKVKLASELGTTSLYALCRRWIRNDLPRKDQPVLWDCPPLPRPLSAAEAEKNEAEMMGNGKKNEETARLTEPELEEPVGSVSEKKILEHHVERFKMIRKRFRDDRVHRIARFKPRLALLLPGNVDNIKRDTSTE